MAFGDHVTQGKPVPFFTNLMNQPQPSCKILNGRSPTMMQNPHILTMTHYCWELKSGWNEWLPLPLADTWAFTRPLENTSLTRRHKTHHWKWHRTMLPWNKEEMSFSSFSILCPLLWSMLTHFKDGALCGCCLLKKKWVILTLSISNASW